MPTDPDQIIDAGMARALQVDAARNTDLLAWIVTVEPYQHAGKGAARLVVGEFTPLRVVG
jgi:hypothetical protein